MSDIEAIEKWVAAFQRRSANEMVACYHEQGTFRDIAFDHQDRDEIAIMWEMICNGDIQVAVDDGPRLDGDHVLLKITDTYTFVPLGGTPGVGRKVVNKVTSRFGFRDGLIIRQEDECDARNWARQAIGGVTGWLAGHIRPLRAKGARAKIKVFQDKKRQVANC